MKRAINWILNRRMIKPLVIASMNDKQKEKYFMLELRSHMQFFGCDVSDMTDEEIKEGYDRFAQLMAATGITSKQAGEAAKRMGELLNDSIASIDETLSHKDK